MEVRPASTVEIVFAAGCRSALGLQRLRYDLRCALRSDTLAVALRLHARGPGQMQNQIDIIRDISARLERESIAYMLTGSMAMNYYAQPRMTRGIEIVIALAPKDAEATTQSFIPDYYVSPDAVKNLAATGYDEEYVDRWTKTLGLSELWRECRT